MSPTKISADYSSMSSDLVRELTVCANKLNDIIMADASLSYATRVKLMGVKRVLINLPKKEENTNAK